MKRALTEWEKEERRNEFLKAGLDEFFEKGFSAARMDDIAARAKLSKGTLYLYFDSKMALFKAIVDSLAIASLDEIEALISEAPPGLPALKVVFDFAPTLILKSPVPRLMKILIGDCVSFPELVQTYRQNVLDRILTVLERTLAETKHNLKIDAPDVSLLAKIVVAPIALSGIWNMIFRGDAMSETELHHLFAVQFEILERALG